MDNPIQKHAVNIMKNHSQEIISFINIIFTPLYLGSLLKIFINHNFFHAIYIPEFIFIIVIYYIICKMFKTRVGNYFFNFQKNMLNYIMDEFRSPENKTTENITPEFKDVKKEEFVLVEKPEIAECDICKIEKNVIEKSCKCTLNICNKCFDLTIKNWKYTCPQCAKITNVYAYVNSENFCKNISLNFRDYRYFHLENKIGFKHYTGLKITVDKIDGYFVSKYNLDKVFYTKDQIEKSIVLNDLYIINKVGNKYYLNTSLYDGVQLIKYKVKYYRHFDNILVFSFYNWVMDKIIKVTLIKENDTWVDFNTLNQQTEIVLQD